MFKVLEVSVLLGEVTMRDLTPLEVAQNKIDEAEAKRATAILEATEANRVATTIAARSHARSLGFTEAMLTVMFPLLDEFVNPQIEEAPSE